MRRRGESSHAGAVRGHAGEDQFTDLGRGLGSAPSLGAAWGSEYLRADVLQFNRDGSGLRVFATGLRNCVGMALNPLTRDLWCSTNERDGLGDDLPPDYITQGA